MLGLFYFAICYWNGVKYGKKRVGISGHYVGTIEEVYNSDEAPNVAEAPEHNLGDMAGVSFTYKM